MGVKKLHYCWFGGNDMPDYVKSYMNTWLTYCPDFEIKRWDETNFDIHCNLFVEQAYKEKKWAFVSDYVRCYALYTEGGLYVDTDVEFIRPINNLLTTSFLGYERHDVVSPGLILYAKNAHSSFYEKLLKKYDILEFSLERMHELTSPIIFTDLLRAEGLKCDNSLQVINDITVYPMEYFNPIGEIISSKPVITENTYTIHHFQASWFSDSDKNYFNFKKKHGEFWGRAFFILRHPVIAIKKKLNSRKNK